MLKKAAAIAMQYNSLMNQLSEIRLELYDCAEIPHMFDLLLEENLLQTYQNDEAQIKNSLEYMRETGQVVLYIQTKKRIAEIFKKLQELAPDICTVNKAYIKICPELAKSNTALSISLMNQLECLSHMINRYFQEL